MSSMRDRRPRTISGQQYVTVKQLLKHKMINDGGLGGLEKGLIKNTIDFVITS